ncbi:hypothetical protein [Bradyrhizobium zhanjiangense]|uniref:Uncharacterized protein n=1 Tax=Bradyrhizobium zhanjiangense TaxID=1325107 RepID=A0A4Q0QMV1_9BRAD|nr:hypothetical protein [Bradyrhizobium zhanjiangense]RXG95803.1 hypothetical protein EAS61_18355 [Bradyrhizobium zhanjiangense]
MKDDQEDAFEKTLSTQLSRNIDFAKFAETKNAALLMFSFGLDHRLYQSPDRPKHPSARL